MPDVDYTNLISMALPAWQTPMRMVQKHPGTNIPQRGIMSVQQLSLKILELGETLQAARFLD